MRSSEALAGGQRRERRGSNRRVPRAGFAELGSLGRFTFEHRL